MTTTEGNTFYTHKGRKESVWVAPEEIKEGLLELGHAEAREAEQARLEQQEEEEEAMKIERMREEEEEEEVDRIKAEVQGLVKRRKRGELEPLDEVVITKKARVEEDDGEEVEKDEDEDEDEEDEESENESESDEDWQKEAAAQLAAEAEEDERRREEEAKRIIEAEEAEAKRAQEKQSLNMPDRVDLSLDEAKALFKVFGSALINYSDAHSYHRRCCERRISTPCTLGIPLCLSLSPTLDMYSSPPSQHAVTLSTNTAEIVLVSCDKKTSRRKNHKRIPKKNSTPCSVRR